MGRWLKRAKKVVVLGNVGGRLAAKTQKFHRFLLSFLLQLNSLLLNSSVSVCDCTHSRCTPLSERQKDGDVVALGRNSASSLYVTVMQPAVFLVVRCD